MAMQTFLRFLAFLSVGVVGSFLVFLTFPLLKVKKSEHRAFFSGGIIRSFATEPPDDPQDGRQLPSATHFAGVAREN